ncbi:MAG: hypothetical protein HZA25_01600 [Candidatus Niyogibacteria bacterium]|nr:hypothetical protein [Candidatus Niyogibacteria bacterium]
MSSRIKNVALVVLLGFFVLYFIYEAKDLLYGLSAEITYPSDGATLSQSIARVEGRVHGAAFVTLDGRKIYTDESGRFSEEFILAPGLNILTLTATDRFGKIAKDTRSVVVK